MYIRTIELACCWIHEHSDMIHTVFRQDMSESVFAPTGDTTFAIEVTELGYTDPMRFALEHEVGHQIVANMRGEPHSRVVWAAAHHVKMGAEDKYFQDEEHLVNRLLRFVGTGEEDPDYGQLRSVFGDRLPHVARRLLQSARPWLFMDRL